MTGAALDSPAHASAAPHPAAHGHGHGPAARLWALLQLERRIIVTLLGFSMAVGVLVLATPIAVQALVDAVAFGGLLQPVLVLAAVLFGCLALAAAFRALQTYVVEILQRRLFVRVLTTLARRLPRVRLEVGDDEYPPEFVNRFFDVVTLQKAGTQLLIDGFTIVLVTTMGLLLLAFYHPLMLALDLVLVVGIFVVTFGLSRGGVRTAIDESKKKYEAAAWLQELALHPIAFRGPGGPAFAASRADEIAAEWLACRRAHFRVQLRHILGALALQVGASTLVLVLGGWLVIDGTLSLGQLVASEVVVTIVVGKVAKLGKWLEDLYDLCAAVDKLGHLWELPLEPEGDEAPLHHGPARVEVEEATLVTGARCPLDGVDVTIEPGERVALIGPPGAGKSALLEVIYGGHVLTSGVVRVDGVDVRDIVPDAHRARVALVRGAEVIAGSILDNIRFGREHVGRDAARAALRAVGLFDAVSRLPEGLDQRVITGGAPLSPVQARLLTLARAIAGAPSLLLLDQSFDDVAAQNVWPFLGWLAEQAEGPTLLVATSRPEVAALFARRLELEGGRVRPAQEAAP
ncbi:MAG: ATP-binding cassette domain-containing protein [Planctomycetes bacterium]|nr:ATP-binding cassette domain-containing protein [Planctomycetota bacterium]